MTKRTPPFSPEARERAVRMVLGHQGEHASQAAAIRDSAEKVGCNRETLRSIAARSTGAPGRARPGPARRPDHRRARTAEGARARGPRAAPSQRDPQEGERVLHPGGARPPARAIDATRRSGSDRKPAPRAPAGIAPIDAHRGAYGVEPIGRALPIAPPTYHAHAARRADPGRQPARLKRGAVLRGGIRRAWEASFGVYGVRKVWRQLLREGIRVARCKVARLMRDMGLRGVVRGKGTRATIADKARPCPADQMNRQCPGAKAPERAAAGALAPAASPSDRPKADGSRVSRTWRPGRGSPTWPSWSTPSPGGSSAGGCRVQRRRVSPSTRWSRRCATAGLPGAAGSFTTATGAVNTC